MSEAFFNALDQSKDEEPKQSSFFNALEKDDELKSPTSNSFFDALDADTSLSAGSDAPPVSGSNQPSLSFDPSLIEPIGSSMTGNPIEANTLMADQISAGDAPQVITYEPEPIINEELLTPAQREFERLNRIFMKPPPTVPYAPDNEVYNLNPSISQVQGDIGNFRMADNAGYIANLPLSNTEALKRIAEANVYKATNNALSRGVGRLSQVTNILGQQLGLKDTSEFISRMQELDRIYPDAPKEVQDALKKISETETYGQAFMEMIKNPGAVLSVVGESFPMMLPGLAAATGVTLATGNPILGAMTIGASSGSVEFGNVLMEELQQSGVDMDDNAALEAQLNNGEFWARARKRATARGVPIALFDALSFGIAGKLTGLARGSGFKTTAAAVGTESVALQPFLGATGERVAQEAELQLGFREKINKGEVALEGVSEAPIGIIETATGIINEQKNQDPVEQYFREANKLLDKSGSDLNAATQIAIEQQVPVQDIDYTAKLLELAVQYENIGTESGITAGKQIRNTIERANSDDPKQNTFARQSFSKQTIEFHTERVAKFKAEAEGTKAVEPKPENVFEGVLAKTDKEKTKFDLAMKHPEAGPVLKDMAEKMQMLSDRMHELGYIWYEANQKATTPKEIKNAASFMSNMGSAMRLINRTQANVLGYQGKRAITDEQLSRDISALQSLISAPESFPSLENVQANPDFNNVQTQVKQPTVDSTDASTVDVTAQPDPTLTRDDPTDLSAPLKVEPPKVDTTPPKPAKVEPSQILNPQDRAEVGIDTDGVVESVQTPDGQKTYNVKGKVVELEDLKQAVGDLQPRDRSKKESAVLATQRAGTMFNPQRLLNDPTSGSGAPIIARDGTIMSGNGRVLTMQEVYANQPKSLEAYQTALKEAGINTEGFSQPVFVRQLNDNMTVDQLKEFADLSNTEAQAQMTSTETAQRDAKRMPQNLINLFTGGDVTSIENKSFVTGFAVQVLSPTEQGQFSVNGKPTKNAIDRMRAAILATAYDDTDTLSIMLDSTDDNIKAISSAMMSSAPQLSQLKADIKEGNIKPDFDISKQISEAAKTISNLREQKVKPRDYFDQQDAFSDTDPLTEAIIKAFYNDELTRAKSQKFMTDVLNFYVEESSNRQENALFEDEVTPTDVVKAARKKAERKADGTDENQGNLLAEASPSKSVNESRKQTQSPRRTRSSKRLDADEAAAVSQEDELGGSTSDPSNVVTTTSGFVFNNVSQTLRQSIYRDAFADSGLSVDAIENKSTEAKFKILARTVKDKFGLSGVKAPKGGGYTQVNQLLDAYHNLQWMTHSLAMPNTFIGLDGKLSLELPDKVGRYLGAFESGSNNVIMPQRSNSFAHEFGHALDFYLMDKYGNLGFMESSRGISGLIRATAKAGDTPWQDGTPVNVETAFGNMINALFLDNAELSFKVMQLEQAIAKGEAREAKTGVTPKSLEKLRSQLNKLLEGSGRSKVAPTKFKETSAQFGKSVGMKDYYLRPTEMFARAFEAYIARTVEAAGGRNEFITKGDEAYKLAAEQVKGSDIRLAETFPKDHERHNIFLAMDRLMDALRTESIAEGTVAEAPGDTDMIDARANFWGSMQYEERNNMKDIPKRVVQSIINDQKRAYRIAQGRAETLKLRPQKYAGNNFVERKINEYRDLFGGNFIETKRQILFNASDQNKDNKRVRDIMENIISKVATDPGTRQDRVTKQTGTFEEATRIETRRFYAVYDQIAKKYDMDLLTDADQKSLRLLLTGESEATAKASPETLKLAGELRRRLLNPIYDYMVKSGQDINYVQGVGYMPRMLDAPLAIQEKPDFMGELEGNKGAVPLYRNVIFENEYGVYEEGDLDQMKALVKLAMSNPDRTDLGNRIAEEYSDLRDIAEEMREKIKEINRLEKTIDENPSAGAEIQEIIDSMDQEHFKLHEELRDPYALTAAEDWHKRISVREGADPSTNGVQGSYAKKRKLPPETDKYMNDFYLNPTDALMQYIPSAVRATEYNKLFGKDLVPEGKKLDSDGVQRDYLQYLIDEAKMAGMPAHQAQEVNTIVQMVTGRYPGPDGSFNQALNTINTFGTMALLPRAVLSSVAEPITAAIQTGSTVKGFKNFILSLDGLGASLRGKDAVERKMYYAQLANILGVIDLPQTGEVVANRLGGTVAEDAKNTMRLATFFLRTGLTNITIAQRKSSMRIGIQYIIEQAAQYNNPDVSAAAKEEARQTLRDFGINNTILSQFTEFAQNLDKTDNGLYEIDQIMDVDGSLTDMGRVLATAVNRFVDQTIQDPKIIDRPKWAESPIGRIVFGIQSFIAAFQRNVLEMSVKRAARDFKTQGYVGGGTRLVRKMMLPLFSLYAGHTLVSAAREFVFNRNKWEEEAEEEDRYIPLKYLSTLGISRSGLLGRADPVFNGFFSLKYQADLSNVAVGASGAYYLKQIQRIFGLGVENSPNTVSREYQAVRGLYDILVPALAGGLATIPGVSSLLGYGLGAVDMAVTSPSVKHWVVRNIIYKMYKETYYPNRYQRNKETSRLY